MRAGGSQGSLNSRREQGHRRPSGDWCPLGVCVWSGQEVREPGSGKMMVGTQGLWWGQLKREVRRSGLEGENGLGQGRCSRERAGPGGLPLGVGEAGPGEPWAQGLLLVSVAGPGRSRRARPCPWCVKKRANARTKYTNKGAFEVV